MAGKALVTYFSATGTTAKLAKKLADETGADLVELVPTDPYTEEDLTFLEEDGKTLKEDSRNCIEAHDDACRPGIVEIPDVSGYDVVYLGFPIWWYTMPKIICTFLEGAALDGKKLAIFVTSGSTGVDDAEKDAKNLAPKAEVIGAKRFEAEASASELKEWADSL